MHDCNGFVRSAPEGAGAVERNPRAQKFVVLIFASFL